MKKLLLAMLLSTGIFVGSAPKAEASIMAVSIGYFQKHHPNLNNLTMAVMMVPFGGFLYGGLTGRMELMAVSMIVFLGDNAELGDVLEAKLSEEFPFIENSAIIKEIAAELKASAVNSAEGDAQYVSLSDARIAEFSERVEANDEQAATMRTLLGSN